MKGVTINDQADSASNFLIEIEKIRRAGSVDYMDAIIHYCEKNEVEIEVIAKYIKKNVVLKAKLQEEAEDLNFLMKTSRLPV